MLTMTGSNIAPPPFSSTSSRAAAIAAGDGAGCASATVASNWQASTTGAKRRYLAFMGRSFCVVSGPLDDAPAFRSGDHGHMGEPDEKPVFNHPRNGRQPVGQRTRIGDPLQGA